MLQNSFGDERMSLYDELMNVPGGEPDEDYAPGVRRKEHWFYTRCYSACEGILDARKDSDIPMDKHTRKAMRRIHQAQYHFARKLVEQREEDYDNWHKYGLVFEIKNFYWNLWERWYLWRNKGD